MQDFAFEGCDSGCSVYCGALSLGSAKAASVRKAAKLGGIIPDFGGKVKENLQDRRHKAQDDGRRANPA